MSSSIVDNPSVLNPSPDENNSINASYQATLKTEDVALADIAPMVGAMLLLNKATESPEAVRPGIGNSMPGAGSNQTGGQSSFSLILGFAIALLSVAPGLSYTGDSQAAWNLMRAGVDKLLPQPRHHIAASPSQEAASSNGRISPAIAHATRTPSPERTVQPSHGRGGRRL